MSDPGSAAPSPADRRLHPREAASEPIRLVAASGAVFEATIVDRSLRGMRIQFAGVGSLPAEITVLAPASGAAHQAKVVWRSAPYAGLLLTRTVDMRSASGPDTADLRRVWREHVSR